MLRILTLSLVISFCLNVNAQSPFAAKNKSKIVLVTPNDVVVINGKKSGFDNKFNSKSYIGTPLNLQNRKEQSNIVEEQNLKFKRAPFTGMPILIKGYQSRKNNVEVLSKGEVLGLSKQFLKNIQSEICVEDTDQEFVLLTQEKENGYNHLKFQQVYKGVPIYGAEIFVHLEKDASLSFNGRNQPTPYLENLTPNLSKEEAIQEVIEDVKAHASYHQMGEKELAMYTDGQYVTELIILPSEKDFGMFNLAYHITIRPNFMERFEYFIDAQTGEILNHYNNTCSLDGLATANATTLNGNTVEINTYQYQGNYYLFDGSRDMYSGPTNGDLPPEGSGYIETLDFQNKPYSQPAYVDISNSNNNWNNDRSAVSAHYNAGKSYEYFRNTHNRKSINGQNGDILSFVNVADENGGGFDNAFWNGQHMFYGNGKTAFKPLAGALDVAGHEMSHGVIQSTANLNYQGESGAINESMADVFGVLIDRDDWTLGEDVVKTSAFPSGALRSMIDPHNGANTGDFGNGWQPKHYDERYTGNQDNGGVHINSGIPNYAFYLIASTIGKDKAEKIYYSTLKNYLTRSSQFIDLRLAVLEAAKTISGVSTSDINAIQTAFGNVGIGDGAGSLLEPEIEENNGGEFVLSLDNNPDNVFNLYLSNTVPDQYFELSKEAIFRKPSVSDNGCHLYYIVETDKRVRYINLCSGSNFVEETKSIPGGVSRWDNVAVSKNGEMLALIPEEYDNAIYIYNISSHQIRKFDLYTPTFTEGVTIETVQYADAIEWDYTGEFVMYDAYNIIEGGNGDPDIDYWDVGVINVLDGNNFADGEISQIFTNLPEDISIGNPTFSKNSPFIIAFDYWDVNADEIRLMAANLETSDIGTIVDNSDVLTYPSYSVNDRIMIYDAQGTINGEEVAVINKISLQNDKINKSGTGQEFIGYAYWGVWFARGERMLPTGLEEVSVVDLSIAPNPFVDAFELNFSSDEKINISIYNLDGKLVKSFIAQNGEDKFTVNTSNWPTGTYILNIQGQRFSENRKLVKIR